MNDQEFGIRLDIASILEEDMADLAKFMRSFSKLPQTEIAKIGA